MEKSTSIDSAAYYTIFGFYQETVEKSGNFCYNQGKLRRKYGHVGLVEECAVRSRTSDST